MKKLLLAVLGIVVVGVALMFGLGFVLPPDHAARCSVVIQKEPAELWTTVADVASWADWNAGIESMEPRLGSNGNEVWLVTADFGEAELEVTRSNEPVEMETHMDAGSFTGTWLYEFQEVPAGTSLTITEKGTVANPFNRAMMFFADKHGAMTDFMLALGERHGLTVEPFDLDVEG